MALILKANRELQQSVEYQRLSLVSQFLYWAGEYAQKSIKIEKDELDCLKFSISSIVMSSLSVESFVNEVAEEILTEGERECFDRCRNNFKNKSKLSNTVWKLYYLLNFKENGSLKYDDEFF